MASTQARMTARARARAAQQKVLADRKRRDEANMGSLTAFFTAAEQIDAATLAMARALDDIRGREGTLAAAATLAGISTGEARKLLALLTDTAPVSARTSSGDDATPSDFNAAAHSDVEPPPTSATHTTVDAVSSVDATVSGDAADNGGPDDAAATGQG